MIGIIGAMEVEIEGLKQLLGQKTTKKIGNLEFFIGKIFDKEVVLVRCGIGKVNAALATAVLLTTFEVVEVVNIGIAGGIGADTCALDIVVADRVAQHDFDLTAVGYELGQTQRGHEACYDCCDRIAARLMDAAQKYTRCFRGVIVSGDKFVASSDEVHRLKKIFGANACDMESGAIEQVCRAFGKDFGALRTLSDSADENAVCDFAAFEKKAADISISIICDYLSQ